MFGVRKCSPSFEPSYWRQLEKFSFFFLRAFRKFSKLLQNRFNVLKNSKPSFTGLFYADPCADLYVFFPHNSMIGHFCFKVLTGVVFGTPPSATEKLSNRSGNFHDSFLNWLSQLMVSAEL